MFEVKYVRGRTTKEMSANMVAEKFPQIPRHFLNLDVCTKITIKDDYLGLVIIKRL